MRTEYHHGQVLFTIRQDPDALRCSVCGSRDVGSRGCAERRFKCLPIGGKPVSVVFPIPRVACAACGALRQVEIGFAYRRRSYAKPFERYALDLLLHMTIQDVAEHLNVSWDLVKDIQKRDLARRFANTLMADMTESRSRRSQL